MNPEPDWKGILTELAATLEQYGDRLPIPVIKVLKTTQELLDGKAKPQVVSKSGVSTKRHLIPKNQEGGDNSACFAFVRAGEWEPWGNLRE